MEPGYQRPLLPAQAPDTPDEWSDVMADIERVIMPGVTHWHSPHFHAYFAAGNSYPAILADMLSDAIGCIGFTWVSTHYMEEISLPGESSGGQRPRGPVCDQASWWIRA
nr:aromatic-L-amino-acid decarboxylase-like [Cherax quadricarinatus]